MSRAPSPSQPLLRLAGVTKRFGAGAAERVVLGDVSLELWPGDLIAVRGGRRAGKTTLLRVAAGITPVDAGVVSVDGRDVWRCAAAERARLTRWIGWAPSRWPTIRGASLAEHVALPLLADGWAPRAATAAAHELLDRVGLDAYADAHPLELHFDGMRLVGLARALVRRPRVLLVDEPPLEARSPDDTALDVAALLRDQARDGVAVIVASQRAVSFAAGQQVASLDAGRLRLNARPTAQVHPLGREQTD